jgi:hypothetical protein
MSSTQRALLRRPRRSQPHHQLDALEQVGDGRTKVMVWVDMHDLEDSRAEVVRPMIEESMANMSRC